MIKVTSQREKETWQMIPQSSPSPSWAALQHNKVLNLFPGEKNYFENLPKIPRSTRGISTFPNPGGSLGEEKINVELFLIYMGKPFYDLMINAIFCCWYVCLHGETICEDSTNIRYLQVGELNLGDQVGGAENNHNLEHRVLQVNISFYRAQGVAGKHISFYRA